jgi:hypothetical protein
MDAPSARMIAASAQTRTVTDALGRRIAVRKLGVLERLRVFRAAGPTLSGNQPWLGMAMLACSVTAVDDVPVPMPGNEQQIEAMVGRLGDAGIAAVADAFRGSPATSPGAPPPAETVANAGN